MHKRGDEPGQFALLGGLTESFSESKQGVRRCRRLKMDVTPIKDTTDAGAPYANTRTIRLVALRRDPATISVGKKSQSRCPQLRSKGLV